MRDKTRVEAFFDVPEGIDTICIHCAAIVTLKPDYSPELMETNVGGTKNVIAACFNHSSNKKLVYVSSTGAIPELPKGQKIKEVNRFDPDKVIGCYSQSKALASQAVYNLVRNNSFDYSKATRELSYSTRPYSETLHDLAMWLREEHMLKAT